MRSSESLALLPNATHKTPAAPGSSVPACPIRLKCSNPFKNTTTPLELIPGGLIILIIPLYEVPFSIYFKSFAAYSTALFLISSTEPLSVYPAA